MTSKALDVLTLAIEDGDYSEGWMIETTNHPYRLEGTEGFTVIADGKGDFEAEVFFGHTPKWTVLLMSVPIERIDRGYEDQAVRDGYVTLVSFRHPTWTWAWGGISVLLDDANGPEEDEDECEEGCCALPEPKVPDKAQSDLSRWYIGAT